MTSNYNEYLLVDSAVGTRLLLGFAVSVHPLRERLRSPWQIAPLPVFSALGLREQDQPNLLLIFHHLLP
jgi:hypothetical protein